MAADTDCPTSKDSILEDCKLPDENGSASAWLSDWWQSAKEKSSSALEFMKRDLVEFSQVIQHDTASAVTSTTAILKEKLRVDDSNSVAGRAKQSFNDLLQTVSGALYPIREPDDHELVMIRDSQVVLLDKWQSELHILQCDPSTFSHEPRGPPELYEKWLEDFSLSEKQKEAEDILRQCSEIKIIHQRLVPSSVSELEFWQRYFYCVFQLQESRRAELVSRVNPKEELPWDEDDDPVLNDAATKKKLLAIGNSQVSNDGDFSAQDKISENSLDDTILDCEVKTNDFLEKIEVLLAETASMALPEVEGSNISPPSCDSSEKGTTSDEWEKDFDGDLIDPSLTTANAEFNLNMKEKEDWENWE